MEFIASIRLSLKKWDVFSGRIPRQDFWFFYVFAMGVFNIAGSMDWLLFRQPASWLYGLAFICMFMPILSNTVRRLHDVKRSGWYWFLWFLPIVGWIILLIWFCTKGTTGDNRFGYDPLQNLPVRIPTPAPTTFKEAIQHGFAEYGIFSGRARRLEYWYWHLFFLLATLSALAIDFCVLGSKLGTPTPINSIVGSFLMLPGLSVVVRRLHDLDKSGWYYWLGLIPIVGWIILLVWLCTKGTTGDNRFGADPLAQVASGA